MKHEYVDKPRAGDHICYISNLSKMKRHYPKWSISVDLKSTLTEIHNAWAEKLADANP